ncbi:hypothetical protein [Plastoroseomonas hellenica]|uniref:hypothetical protein n=1 Tax=Plastoroseomonas hellenica TaxID=2687306 RepID=UPI001BAB57EC|nr:hypothetical protein [Plastoroseomonas hellenica]MBR0643375.1 hypothetical protein [Plastoroseomonas hellenica]
MALDDRLQHATQLAIGLVKERLARAGGNRGKRVTDIMGQALRSGLIGQWTQRLHRLASSGSIMPE